MLALLIFPMLAILSATALAALAPTRMRSTYLLPAVRTVALVTAAVALVHALWSHE